jgi:hypothetical protein
MFGKFLNVKARMMPGHYGFLYKKRYGIKAGNVFKLVTVSFEHFCP